MAKKEEPEGISNFPSDSLKATKKTALVFLDLSRLACQTNANPYCITNFVGSTDLLQVLNCNGYQI